MQIFLGIISVLLLVLSVLGAPLIIETICDDIKWYHYIAAIAIALVLAIGSICTIKTAITVNKPKAIDVYRNKTTLKITYVDSIPQDTIVVFK